MQSRKFTILHFQPLELYPPVLNFVSCLKNYNNIKTCILTTKWKYKFDVKIPCFRLGYFSKNKIIRYLSYFNFNIIGFIILFIKRPHSIIYFETLSVLPVYIYKRIFRKTRILVHFHEYTTLAEYHESSIYYKFLYRCECKLLNSVYVVSHTNEERLNLFKADNNICNRVRFEILPNYPPLSWYKYFDKKNGLDNLIRFVYVGSISLQSMYLELFANYIKSQPEKVVWNIYSNNYEPSVKKYFYDLDAKNIYLNEGVQYDLLPEILNKHDVGVILYNGIMQNYIFCVPNKLLEYYSCGLQVLCSSDLISSQKFIKINNLTSIIPLDFKNHHEVMSIIKMLSYNKIDSKIFDCESIYNSYIKTYITV
jgi:hypothetical protein